MGTSASSGRSGRKNPLKKLARPPLTIGADAGLKALIDALLNAGVSRHLYVVDPQGRLCGSVSVLALLEQMSLNPGLGNGKPGRQPDPNQRVRVRDIMDLRPRYATRDTPLAEAIQIMVRERLTELPVVDRHLRLTGEVRALDLLRNQNPPEAPPPRPEPDPAAPADEDPSSK